MQGVATPVRVFFVLTTLLLFTSAKGQQPVQIESDVGVISMVVTVEAIDVTNQVLTVSGPQNNWVTVKVTPEDIKRIKVKDRITISYSDEVAVALQKLNEAPQNQMVSEEESGMNMSKDCVLRFKRNGRVSAVASIFRDLESLEAEVLMEQATAV